MDNANPSVINTNQWAGVTDSVDKVDRIRDLLFGPHMRDYTQQLAAISHDLLSLTQETARLAVAIQDQENKFTQFLRQDLDRLAAQLQDQGQRAQQQLQQVDHRLTEQWKVLDQSHTQRVNNLAHGIARSEQALRTELHALAEGLNQRKVDRPVLGDLLIELGHSLKSTEPIPLPVAEDLLDQVSQALA